MLLCLSKDGDLWDFLNDPPKIFDFLQTLPEESGVVTNGFERNAVRRGPWVQGVQGVVFMG